MLAFFAGGMEPIQKSAMVPPGEPRPDTFCDVIIINIFYKGAWTYTLQSGFPVSSDAHGILRKHVQTSEELSDQACTLSILLVDSVRAQGHTP